MPFLFSWVLCFVLSASSIFAQESSSELQVPITSPRCDTFTFDSTGSYDPDNEKITFEWNFGDGSFSNQPVIEHVYQVSGDYEVTLTTSDHSSENCCSTEVKQTVRAIVPPDARFNGPDRACTGVPVLFTNTSKNMSEDSFGYVYHWDFGDGTRSSENGQAEKIYTKGGEYKVSLSVDNQKDPVCGVRSFSKNIYVNQPPTADAGADVVEQCLSAPDQSINVSFSAVNSSDENGDPLRYTWDFGDGTQGQGIQVVHTYAQPGNYEVKLVVNDQSDFSCSTAVDFIQLRVGVAPKAEAGGGIVACPGEEIAFDGSDSYAQTKGTLEAKWDFGDGQFAEALKSAHIYRNPGRYSAVLSVKSLTNQSCPESQDTKAVLINTPPQVTLGAAKSYCVGQAVELSATAQDPDGDNLEYYWTFGDGTIMRGGSKVTHQYRQGGQYRVSVIVDDGQKTSCSTGTAEAVVKINTPPQAHVTAPAEIHLGKAAEFNASVSTDPDADDLTYQWDFGDGKQAEGVIVRHTYQERGSYQVKLQVNDNSGTSCGQANDSVVTEVKSAPVAVMSIR